MIILSTLHSCLQRMARLLLLVAAMCVLYVMDCRAQNNAYGINDRLYAMYADAYRDRTTMRALEAAEQIYDEAVRIGDNKARCLALTLPVIYWYWHREDKRPFFQAVDRLQAESEKFGIEQYYYFGSSNKVNYLIITQHMGDAIKYVGEIEKYARRHKHNYGIYIGLCAMGQIYLAMRDSYLAIYNYNKALYLHERAKLSVDKANIYRRLAGCYEDIYDYDKMLHYGIKAYEECRSEIMAQRTVRVICDAALMLRKYDVFDKFYDIYRNFKKTVSAESAESEERSIAILKMLRDGECDRALTYLNKGRETQATRRLKCEYYRMKGDYRSLAYEQRRLYRMHLLDIDEWHSESFDEMNSRFLNMGIDMRHQQLLVEHQEAEAQRQEAELKHASLQLANTQLTLKNSSLELARTNSESDVMRMSYNKKLLEATRLKGHLAVLKAHNDLYDTLAVVGIGMGLVAFIGIGFYLKSRASLMADVKDVNMVLVRKQGQLVVAKEHAEKANDVKGVFLKNMSNDIRQPLENISQLSKMIAENNRSMSKEELQLLTKRLGEHTGDLLDIVDDVLKRTQQYK